MPWARTDWMSERLKFIAAYLEYQASFPRMMLPAASTIGDILKRNGLVRERRRIRLKLARRLGGLGFQPSVHALAA